MKFLPGICILFLVVALSTRTWAVAAVRDADSNRPGAVRDANPSHNGPVRDANVVPVKAPVKLNATVIPVRQNADGIAATGAESASNTDTNDNNLRGIKNQFVGGVEAIRDSGGKLIGLAASTVEQGVVNAARPIVNAAQHVVNRTVNIASNLQHAGHDIVDTWGNSFQQSKNITGQLINNIG